MSSRADMLCLEFLLNNLIILSFLILNLLRVVIYSLRGLQILLSWPNEHVYALREICKN